MWAEQHGEFRPGVSSSGRMTRNVRPRRLPSFWGGSIPPVSSLPGPPSNRWCCRTARALLGRRIGPRDPPPPYVVPISDRVDGREDASPCRSDSRPCIRPVGRHVPATWCPWPGSHHSSPGSLRFWPFPRSSSDIPGQRLECGHLIDPLLLRSAWSETSSSACCSMRLPYALADTVVKPLKAPGIQPAGSPDSSSVVYVPAQYHEVALSRRLPMLRRFPHCLRLPFPLDFSPAGRSEGNLGITSGGNGAL